MRRLFPLLLLAAGCGRDTAHEQVRRGHATFGASARALAAGLVAETKAASPDDFKKLLASSGAADEAAFVDASAREILVRYGVVLATTDEQARDYAAGRFDDPGNRTRVQDTLAGFARAKAPLPEVGRYAADRVRAGDWTGLNLEFAARILWAELMRPR
jgi:hypothetical protein